MQARQPVVVTSCLRTVYVWLDLSRPGKNVNHGDFIPEERVGLGKFFEAGLIDTFRHLYPHTVK
ncbi:MAG TPA: hypothetical protein VII97_08340 [Anaerolineales bacterium]